MPRDLSFPKQNRLTRPTEFQRVRKEGTVWRGSLMTVAVLRDEPVAKMRAGFITSRKVGGAVIRNRVRRRLREIVRCHQHEAIDGIWMVVIASSRSAAASYRALEDEWLRLSRRASILTP